MAKVTRIRDRGAIPERRHDAFLLALLLAVSLNVAFFALQALIPKIANLLQVLGPEAAVPKEEEHYPFILVNDSLLEEELDPLLEPHALSDRARDARQVDDQSDLPIDRPQEEEGVEELLSFPPGNPGPAELSPEQIPGEIQETPAPDEEDSPSETEEPSEPQENSEPDEFQDLPEAPEVPEAIEQMEIPEIEELPELSEPPPELEPLPEPPPESEPLPEPPQEIPEPEPIAEPQPFILPIPEPEEVPESPPVEEPLEDLQPYPEPVPVEEMPEIDPTPYADPALDMVDLASLPIDPEGFMDPQTRLLEEIALRSPTTPSAWPEPPQEQYVSQQYQPPQAYQQPQPERPRSSRSGRSEPPPIKQLGGGAQRGGTPQQRNRSSRVNLLDSDSNMRVLAHRYGAYMRKLQMQLQESLNRVVRLNPTSYNRGNARLQFTIAADGTLAAYITQDHTLESVRMISETTLREAAPFDPPTQEMLQDPLFQRMTLTVNLY